MIFNKLRFILLFLALPFSLSAQDLVQTIRGRVLDAQSQSPLPFANVRVLGADPIIGATADAEGLFKLSNVPVGRVSLEVSFVGYSPITLSNLVLTSGKELLLMNITLEELLNEMEEVVVTAETNKAETNTDLATVSARSFNVEETSRYAGSRNDPARMASNFAGVSGANDGRNDIIIRGNSPSGLLWRLEGVDIPSPNHFSALGTTGGPVSMLNNNLLDKSDFMTAAFPSQYGNALAGVFDLQMRNGNNEKHEFLGQIGFNGFEAGAEGPLSRKHRGSYLINYRYSTLAVFDKLGMGAGTGAAVPYYQDLSFKIDLPTLKAGRFSVFALAGKSSIDLLGSEADTTETDLYGNRSRDIYNSTQMAVVGFNHRYFFNESTYSNLVLAASQSREANEVDSVGLTDRSIHPFYQSDFAINKFTINYSINKKVNASNQITAGFIGHLYRLNLIDSVYEHSNNGFITVHDFNGQSRLDQLYTTWQHRFSEEWILNAGLHFMHFSLNGSTSLEPRMGLKYKFTPAQSLSLGYGLHSQLQALQSYFYETLLDNGTYIQTNKDLTFAKSHHIVASYDYNFRPTMRLKLETYYQSVYNAAIEQRASSFSQLNSGADFGIPDVDSLINGGTGRNMGIEMTLEKFFSKQYYFLFTTSLFDSKYTGSDGIERNTAFNGRYVINALAGKEFNLGSAQKVLSIDWKVTLAGGRYTTPIDLAKSQQIGETRYDHTQAFTNKLDDYFRTDLKLSFKLNKKKLTHEWAIDFQNLFNTQNIFNQSYNAEADKIVTNYQLGIFVVPQYRIYF